MRALKSLNKRLNNKNKTLNNVLNIKIASSTHNDCTRSGMRRHAEYVKKMKNMVCNNY